MKKNTPYRETEAYRRAAENAAKQNAEQKRKARSHVTGDDNPWGFSDELIESLEVNFEDDGFEPLDYPDEFLQDDEEDEF